MDKMLTAQVSGSEFECLGPMEMLDGYGNLRNPELEKPRLRTPVDQDGQLAGLSKSVSARLKERTLCTCMRMHMFICTCALS